ncbi:MAG: methionine aminotransferase [Bacteroidota bacterium]
MKEDAAIRSLAVRSKLPNVGTTIFTVMSKLAQEHKAINLSQGFPNFDCSPRLQALVSQAMTSGYNQYAPMAGLMSLREQLAQKIERLYDCPIDPEREITITAGATQAIFTVIAAFIHPGDEVILIEPAYDSYGPSVELCGGIVRPYELAAPDYQVNWEALGAMVNERTRMIIINSPHNPSGMAFSASDMQALEQLCRDTNILVLSDEVYEHLIYDGVAHQSILRFPNLRDRALATYSFGKTFHSTGWKLGYCVAPAPLMKEFRKVHQFNVFSVNTPMQHAIAAYLKDPETYLSLAYFYQEKRDFFLSAIEPSRFKPISCTGTYFHLMDYSAISDEPDTVFAQRLTKEYGVAVIPPSAFYASGRDEKMVRVCFAKTEEVLAKAGEVLCRV